MPKFWTRFGSNSATSINGNWWNTPMPIALSGAIRGGSMIPIEMRDLFLAFGLDNETASAAAARQEEHNANNAAFAREA